MIKATELRIGNFILLDGVAKKVVGMSLDLDDENKPIIQLEHTNPIPNTDFEYSVFEIYEGDKRIAPIPITLKILANCGFKPKQLGNLTRQTIKRKIISFSILHDAAQNEIFLNDKFASPGYKYVHDLQNLFYCLMGEELIGGI